MCVAGEGWRSVNIPIAAIGKVFYNLSPPFLTSGEQYTHERVSIPRFHLLLEPALLESHIMDGIEGNRSYQISVLLSDGATEM